LVALRQAGSALHASRGGGPPHRRRDQGAREARVEAQRDVPGARRDDGRPRPRRAEGEPGRVVASRVLVTGITGQDGSYLVDRLVDEGCEAWGMVRPGDAAADAVRPEIPRERRVAAGLSAAEPAPPAAVPLAPA